jgi:transposase-like protein
MMNHPCPNCGSSETIGVYGNIGLKKLNYLRYRCHKCGAKFVHDVVNMPKTDGWMVAKE